MAQMPQQTVPPPPSGAQDALAGDTTDKLIGQQDELRMAGGKKEAEEAASITGMGKGLKAEGFTDEQIRDVIKSKVGGVGMRNRMHPVKVSNPDGTQIPALQDMTTGQVYGTDGKEIQDPTIIPTSLMPTEHTGEMPVYNPQTNQFEQQPTHSTSRKVPPKTGGSGSSGTKAAPATPSGGKGASSGGRGASGTTPAPSATGGHGIPARQFNILQKQATAIDEARNALVGPDPSKGISGLAADLKVFHNPESVKRISEYLGLVNSQIANESKAVAGQGAWAAAEWYVGLPQAVIGLQQGALADASRSLTPGESKFVADYYRVLGTIGGMRAATGASSAQWSYNTLRGELPTPGPVTNYKEAAQRLNNFIQETNVVAKRNPLLATQASASKIMYATNPSGKLHQAPEGTPLPQGWKLTDAPAAQ
jgi:hypothetical protein